MVNVLANGAAFLASQQKAALATDIGWSRGSQTATLSARVGRTVWDVETGDGRVERVESRDFLLDPADLPVKPAEGDTITEPGAYGGKATYRVMAPSGTPPVHWADAYRTTLRVHTKLVERAY